MFVAFTSPGRAAEAAGTARVAGTARFNPDTVAARVAQKLPADLLPYFDTVLYVSKAAQGPWAEHMFVFAHRNGHFALTDVFPVSTGRERHEKYFTDTPAGIFEIDPGRLYRMVHSGKWNGAPMPFSMFLDYSYRTVKTGIALHAAHGRLGLAHLGHRASGGCIRMPPKKAEAMFEMIKRGHRGMVPKFTFNHAAGHTNRDGKIARTADGAPILKKGIRVLLLVDDYAGKAPAHTAAAPEPAPGVAGAG